LGTIEAVIAHIRSLIERLRVTNNQLGDVERKIDRLCKSLSEPVADSDGETTPRERNEQRDAAILDSTPGIGRTVLATLLTEAPDPLQRREYHAFRSLCRTPPGTAPSRHSPLRV